jgi:hypothetical protein
MLGLLEVSGKGLLCAMPCLTIAAGECQWSGREDAWAVETSVAHQWLSRSALDNHGSQASACACNLKSRVVASDAGLPLGLCVDALLVVRAVGRMLGQAGGGALW